MGLRLSIPASSCLLDSGFRRPSRQRAKHTELERAGAFFPVERHSSLLSSPWLWQHFFLATANLILPFSPNIHKTSLIIPCSEIPAPASTSKPSSEVWVPTPIPQSSKTGVSSKKQSSLRGQGFSTQGLLL